MRTPARKFQLALTFNLLAVVLLTTHVHAQKVNNFDNHKMAAGLITCDVKVNKSIYKNRPVGTATLFENRRLILGSAHSFYTESGELYVIPGTCLFNIVSDGGKIIEQAYLGNLWAGSTTDSIENANPNAHLDWALVQLDRDIQSATPVKLATELPKQNQKLESCYFSLKANNMRRRDCVAGKFLVPGEDSLYNNPRLFLTDVISFKGSSGSSQINENGELVSIVIGGKCRSNTVEFDPDSCYAVSSVLISQQEFGRKLTAALAATSQPIVAQTSR